MTDNTSIHFILELDVDVSFLGQLYNYFCCYSIYGLDNASTVLKILFPVSPHLPLILHCMFTQ